MSFGFGSDWVERSLPKGEGMVLARWRPWYEKEDARFSQLVIGNAQLEMLSTGMRWAEGPAYLAAWDMLIWSDIPNNRMMCWRGGKESVFRTPSNFTNGNTVDAQGRLVSCEHGGRRVVRIEHDGATTVLADRNGAHKLNSPNDVVVSRDGTVWFTDPSYGILSDYEGYKGQAEYGACWVFRVDRQGVVHKVVDDFVRPNGLAFSPDESILYVADSAASHTPGAPSHVRALTLNAQGKVTQSRVFAEIKDGVPDGLRVDAEGNVWISCALGIQVHAADGTRLGRIHVPETVANLCFGGPSGSRLFIAATTSIYAIDVAVAGAGLRGRSKQELRVSSAPGAEPGGNPGDFANTTIGDNS